MDERRNRFGSWCTSCGRWVEEGAGFLLLPKVYGKPWRGACSRCYHSLHGGTEPPPKPKPPPRPRPKAIPMCLQILGLTPPVDEEKVKRRFRLIAKMAHPDAGGDAGMFIKYEQAYRDALKLCDG